MNIFSKLFSNLFPMSKSLKSDLDALHDKKNEIEPVTILQMGKVPPKPIFGYKTKCYKCNTLFRWTKENAKYCDDGEWFSFLEIECPLCKEINTFDLNEIDSNVKMFYIPCSDYEI